MAATTAYITLAVVDPATSPSCQQVIVPNVGAAPTTNTVSCPASSSSSVPTSATALATTSTEAPSTPAVSGATTNAASIADTNNIQTPATTQQTASVTSAVPVPGSGAPNPQPSNGSKGLAGGAVAGVAVGMLLAGVILAGIVFFFLLRRQKRRQVTSSSRPHAAYAERNVGPEKGATVVATAVGSIDDLLPQPVEDDAITGDLSKIRDNIKNHVRTYYHSGPTSSADVNEAVVRDVAAITGSSVGVLTNLLSDPTKRDGALRSIVAAVILTRCTGDRYPSLLPDEAAALSSSMAANNNSNSHAILFSKWKTITGALLQQRYGRQGQDSGQAQSSQDTVAVLESILAPFVKGGVDNGQRRKNLDMILARSANFAFVLFAQPGSFRFDFANHLGELVVFPALIQTVGDQGQPLSPTKTLTEKESVPA
ncbi:hypothetical protein C7974DRAFT_111807 [Boeremia exigua]|uniref:uncharacterized protein n=1 Tax=Boeremia exigua TaxID=749465 RepID=UPI001E8CFAE6|nr:uncharacterized protein C7974DRAFT_111807 [Boeremia exigua]KAH6642852.1 hypothetical protein C7974DRAFT_111807 [Boeremia exigua]